MNAAVTTVEDYVRGGCIRATFRGGCGHDRAAFGQDAGIATLIHLNGVTGIGKSTIARGLVERRPLALTLDIDSIRVSLGRWRHREETKQVARRLGFVLAAEHLTSGNDVVVPQLLVRADVIDQLWEIASAANAEFTEVMLTCGRAEALERIHASHRRNVEGHPRDLFSLEELERQLAYADDSLRMLVAERPSVRMVDVSGLSKPEAVVAVEAALARGRR